MIDNISVRVVLASLAFAAGIAAAALDVDLDKPGAMDALKRDRPAHFAKVSEEISKAQEIRVDPHPTLQKAETITHAPSGGGVAYRVVPNDDALLQPVDPARKRIAVRVDDITYLVTVHMTKQPAQLQKAK
jgi:hypothetical protein